MAAPFNRFYMGGENDVRGFELYGVSPIVYVPVSSTVNVLNTDGTPRIQKAVDPTTGITGFVNATQAVPSYQLVFPGGDTNAVANFEYRIPIFGPVTLAIFGDAGVNRLSNQGQLTLNSDRITSLNQQFPEAVFSESGRGGPRNPANPGLPHRVGIASVNAGVQSAVPRVLGL